MSYEFHHDRETGRMSDKEFRIFVKPSYFVFSLFPLFLIIFWSLNVLGFVIPLDFGF